MSGRVLLPQIKSEPSEDEQCSGDASVCITDAEEYVDELEKQLASNLTIEENSSVAAPLEISPPSTNSETCASLSTAGSNSELGDISSLKSKLEECETRNDELRKTLASTQADLATMKQKYLTEKMTLESVTKAKWSGTEQAVKKKHENEMATLMANFKKTEQSLIHNNVSLTTDVARLEKDLKQSLIRVVQFEKDMEASRASLRLLTDKLITTETALEENIQAKDSLEQLYSITKTHYADLTQQLEVFKRKEQSHMEQLSSMEDKAEQVSLLSLELLALKSQHEATKNKLINAESKNLKLESETLDLKKKALSVNLIQRKMEQAQESQRSTDSAMAILVKKLANVEHLKEESECLKSNLKQAQNERAMAGIKIQRLKRRLARKVDHNESLTVKWKKLNLFLRKLEEKAATGEFLTRSDFDTVLHFVLNSSFTDVKKEPGDASCRHDTDEIPNEDDSDDDDITEIEQSQSAVKDSFDKVVRKLKAVEITAKRHTNISESPSKPARRTEKGLFSRKSTNARKTRSNVSSTRTSRGRSLSRSPVPVHRSERKRRSMSSSRRSHSRSLSVESISRSHSPANIHKRCRYRRSRSRSRSYTRCSKSYSRHSPSYYSSHSSSRERPSKHKSFTRNPERRQMPLVDKQNEAHSEKLHVIKPKTQRNSEDRKLKDQLDFLALRMLEVEPATKPDETSGRSSPEIIIIENSTESNAPSLEEGELDNLLLSTAPEAANITEAEWDALILSPKGNSGIDNLAPALAQVSLQTSHELQNNMSHPESGAIPMPQSNQLASSSTLEVIDADSSQSCYEVCNPPSSTIQTMTHCTSEQSTSWQSPEILPLHVVPAPGVSEEFLGTSDDSVPAEELWYTDNASFQLFSDNPRPSTSRWSKPRSRGNYGNVNDVRIVVPPRHPYRSKNKRKFAPYMREDRSSNKIPIELSIQGKVPQQPLPGHSIVEEFMQQYTVSIIKEIPGYSEKHPSEALKDLCISKGWAEPQYTYHAITSRNPRTMEYYCKVLVNNVLHQPKYGSSVKTDAQTIAAIYCLQQLGVNP